MWVYIAACGLILLLLLLLMTLWKKNKTISNELLVKDTALQVKDLDLEQSHQENALLEAKYLKKVKSDEDRKLNLEKYHQKNQEVRKGLQESLETAIENQDKWVPHARETPNSGKLGKPKGAPGGGKHRPEEADKAIHMFPVTCPHCGADLSMRPAHFSHFHYFTDLENLQAPFHEFKALTLTNTVLVMYRKRCPKCRVWIYPDSGPLKYLRYGLNFVCYVISKRISTRMPFEVLVDELDEQFGSSLTLSATAIVDWFKRHGATRSGMRECRNLYSITERVALRWARISMKLLSLITGYAYLKVRR